MELFGIKCVPLNELLRKSFEAVVVTIVFMSLTTFAAFCVCCAIYLLLFTKYWLIVVAYIVWIWIDRRTPDEGGRISNRFRFSLIFDYAANYFPINVKSAPGVNLDQKKNYLLCSFPHGILALGMGLGITSNKFRTIYPNHRIHATTLKSNFFIPLYRDYLLSIGACSVTKQSLNWILNYSNGGKIACLVVGGAAEAWYGTGGQYCLVLKNRKGFIKLSLISGSYLIPALSFGETDLFKQVSFPKDSLVRKLQEYIKRIAGISPLLFYGGGIFQHYFGWTPLRKPINIICGRPIVVNKITNPSQSDIDELHATFVEKLCELFEEYKYQYLEDPEKLKLIIV